MQASVKVTHFAGQPNSIFGPLRQFTLRLAGTPAQQQFMLHGDVVENPSLKIGIRLSRRAELP